MYPPTDPEEKDHPCCYLAGIVGCEGRPLIVEEGLVVSHL
jgi:hypothetical protein